MTLCLFESTLLRSINSWTLSGNGSGLGAYSWLNLPVQTIHSHTMKFSLALPIAAGVVLSLVYFYRKVALKKRCPICRDIHTDRIPRTKFLKSVLGFLPIKAYNCKACGNRYYQIDGMLG